MFLPSARWDELQCIVKVVDTYNANGGARELRPAHNHCTRSTDDEEVPFAKTLAIALPLQTSTQEEGPKWTQMQIHSRASEADPNPISLPPLPPVHFSVGEFQVESHSEDSSSRNCHKTPATGS